MGAEANLKVKNITLPTPNAPMANYVTSVRTGNLLYLSGHGPSRDAAKGPTKGKLGRDLTVEQGYQSARDVGIALLATTRAALGSLDKVKRVVKVLGMVNCTEDFPDPPKVMNGCSDLLVEVFGETVGKHARSAVGMASLPMGIPVEIEMILEVE
jgi:enamine deaminase RidA (YjgF/YER057c/UK114 family)